MFYPPLPDFHIHTHFCGHAKGDMEEYVKRALDSGLKEICFSDHLDRYYLSKPQKRRHMNWGITPKLLPEYLSQVDGLKAKYKGFISIKKGLEIDYIKGFEEKLSSLVNEIDLDFRLGAVHCIPELGWKHISLYSHFSEDQVIRLYFRHMCSAAESGIFDSIAHPLYIFRQIRNIEEIPKDMDNLITELLNSIKKAGITVEINTKDYMHFCRNISAERDLFLLLLDKISKQRVDITTGSDAHAPEDTARGFPDIQRLLKEYGITNVCSFESTRKKIRS